MGRPLKGRDPEEEVPLLPVEEHRGSILAEIAPLPARTLSLDDAHGCVLAEKVVATFDLPPFTSSAMDGFAVRAQDISRATEDDPVPLRVAGEVRMGASADIGVGEGEAVAVSTGGMVPVGADAVVPVELCAREDGRLLVLRALPSGKHVRPAGEDVRRGEEIAPAGRRLAAPDLGALAACGYAEVLVYPPARVGVVSTGDEIVRPEEGSLGEGRIYDSNHYVLSAAVREAGAVAVDGGSIPDDPDELVEALDRLAPDVDAFVCSGGVSMGERDPVKRAFSSAGDVRFVNVAMQPGRPQAFGSWKDKPFFGLPGNPISVFVSFEVFVRPALMKMMGRSDGRPALEATLDAALEAPSTRARYARVLVRRKGDAFVASPYAGHQSNLLVTFSRADGLVEVPAGSRIEEGESCRVILLRDL